MTLRAAEHLVKRRHAASGDVWGRETVPGGRVEAMNPLPSTISNDSDLRDARPKELRRVVFERVTDTSRRAIRLPILLTADLCATA